MASVSAEVLAVLEAARVQGNALYLVGQIDRKLYQTVAKAIEAVGGKWNRKAGAHVFDGDATQAIAPIIGGEKVVSVKQELGQFDTPPGLASLVMAWAGVLPGHTVLEPSCGIGNIVAAAERQQAWVAGVEVDVKRAYEAKEHCLFHGGLRMTDFLLCKPEQVFDRVVMNPPFAPAQADIDHVLHAFKFVRPGGRLVAIMGAGVKFRQTRKSDVLRGLVGEAQGEIIDLPEGSFVQSGTSVNTVLVILPKRAG